MRSYIAYVSKHRLVISPIDACVVICAQTHARIRALKGSACLSIARAAVLIRLAPVLMENMNVLFVALANTVIHSILRRRIKLLAAVASGRASLTRLRNRRWLLLIRLLLCVPASNTTSVVFDGIARLKAYLDYAVQELL